MAFDYENTRRDPVRQQAKQAALYRKMGFPGPDVLDAFAAGNRQFIGGEFRGAVDAYTAALKIDPDFAPARFERARSYRRFQGGEGVSSAIEDYKELLNRGVGGIAVRLILAEAYVLKRQFDRAMEELQAIDQKPMEQEDRVFYLVVRGAVLAGQEREMSSEKAEFVRLAERFEGGGTRIRPTWYTFNSLRTFMQDGGLTGTFGDDFRNWFGEVVEPVVEDRD